MLDPSSDRLDYSVMLRPPEPGFVLQYAVACTYSLDLSALLAALLPLGFNGDAESLCRNNPVFMLHVFKKLLPKIRVFCDAASITVPDLQHNKMLSLLDEIVFPVRSKTAFHPKFWLLRFERDGEKLYRLAVLSKNLTFDRSWDVAMFFDGKVKNDLSNGEPLAAMLEFLKRSQWGQGSRLHELSALADEIKKVEFSNNEIKAEELMLIPFGVNSDAKSGGQEGSAWQSRDTILLNPDASFFRLMVMSPFLAPGTVTHLFQRGRNGAEKLLFTRKSAFSGFSQDQISDIQCYCVKDEVVFGEKSDALDSPPERAQEEDIHAKIYLFQQYQNNTPYLYLGSANLTQNGLTEKNVELLVRVKLRGHNIYETIRNDLLPEDQNGIFEPCETIPATVDDAEKNERDLLKKEFRRLLLTLTGKDFRAEVKPDENLCAVTIRCEKRFSSEYKIELAPLAGNWQQFSPEMKFEPQSVETLSDFYRVRLSGQNAKIERLLVIDTLSSQDLRTRRQVILESSCLKASSDILEYLSYVLSEDPYSLALQKNESGNGHSSQRNAENYQFALYEKLLYWTVTDKKRLLEIREIIHHRPSDNSEETEKLLALCKTFYRAAGGEK